MQYIRYGMTEYLKGYFKGIQMIEETRKYWCDICGREIHDYHTTINVIEIDDDGYAESIGYDMCKDCIIAFNKWKTTRRKMNPEKSYIDRFYYGSTS